MTEQKQKKVLDAALASFLRHGFRRVTMGDIAQEAGLSRPALYLVFPGKEEIFKAVLEQFGSEAVAEIRADLPQCDSLRAKLELVFEVWVVRSYKMLHDAPDAKDLVDCTFGFASGVVDRLYKDIEQVLVEVVEPYSESLLDIDVPPHQLARVMTVASHGFKSTATDVNDLRGLLAGLISMTLVTLGQPVR